MIEVVQWLTITCLLLPVFVYVGYPLILLVLDRIVTHREVRYEEISPNVTLIVSCYNEADVLRDKIQNCLELDYPEDKLDFLFVSDGSTDGTDEIVKASESHRLRLVRQEGRLGKTMGLNLAVPMASGTVVVFSDANAMYRNDAVQMLVRHFADESVGYVVGAAIYRDATQTAAGDSENRYWRYEIFIKQLESRLSSVVGGDGAIYAIRKDLYRQMDPEDINDFVNPLQIIARGFRGVFDPEAICYETTAGEFSREASRKRRIVNRSFTALLKNKRLLNPFRFGFFSFQLLSHKVLRWLIPVFLSFASIGVLTLAFLGSTTYKIVLLLGILFVWTITIGSAVSGSPRVPALLLYPYYFWVVNYNALLGIGDALRGRVQVTWTTPRTADASRRSNKIGEMALITLVFSVCTLLFILTLRSLGGSFA